MKTLSLEFNELNFHYVRKFVEAGQLPNFARLLDTYHLTRTVSEKSYPHLEPWIQWPTVYSGKSYEEHGIFRLGDVVNHQHDQIWETLEKDGLRVAAVSPMNAANRCTDPCFFLPDPWTDTQITADEKTARLWAFVAQAVNGNASDDLGFASVGMRLAPLAMGYVNPLNAPLYARVLAKATRYKWAKAAFLDVLLFDLTMRLTGKHRPDFVSLFMNAAAHIQHHHTFDSAIYDGEFANPGWYSRAAENSEDPLFFIYGVYDDIVGHCLDRDDLQFCITTGLSQIPNPREQYQYRIVDFESCLAKVGIAQATPQARMSRDFLLSFPDRAAAEAAIARMNACSVDGRPMFTIEDRGESLFCQIGYFGPREGLAHASIDGASHDVSNDLVLVSIENAIHQSLGYHVDTRVAKGAGDDEIPLTDVFSRLRSAALAGASRELADTPLPRDAA